MQGARFGPFQIKEKLGQGGMGAVYRALDTRSGTEVALKVCEGTLSPRRAERFRREGEITAGLAHPGIVTLHEAGQVGEQAYLAYELIPGGHTVGGRFTTLGLRQRVELIRDAAAALGYAHSRGVVHRDVKPDNLLLDQEGVVKVADFGLALAADQGRMTRTGATVGTPYYMPPEQAVGDRADVGPHSDVWSLGVILYEALTGEPPFNGETLTSVVQAIVAARPRRVRDLAPGAPRELEQICMRCLRPEPHERYPDAGALAVALDDFLAGRGPRRPNRAGLAALAILGLGLGLAASVVLGTRAGGAESPSRPEVAATSPVTAGPSQDDAAVSPPPGLVEPSPTASSQPALVRLRHADASTDVRGFYIGANQVLSWNPGGDAALWDLEQRSVLGRWAGEQGLTALTLSPDAQGFLAADGGKLKQLSFATGAFEGTRGGIVVPRGEVVTLAFGLWPSGASAVVTGATGSLDLFYRPGPRAGRTINRFGRELSLALALSPRDELVVVLAGGEVRVYAPLSGGMKDPYVHPLLESPASVSFTPSGERFAVGTAGGRVYVFEADALQTPRTLQVGGGLADLRRVQGLVFSSDDALLHGVSPSAGDLPAVLTTWSVADGTVRASRACPLEPTSIDLSPDDRVALLGTSAGELLLWELD